MVDTTSHASDCAVHNEPAMPAGPCDCAARTGAEITAKQADSLAYQAAGYWANGGSGLNPEDFGEAFARVYIAARAELQKKSPAVDDDAMQALAVARLALVSHDNCLITDRSDLPRSEETGWTTDFSAEIALIDSVTGPRIASRCADGSSGQQTEQTEAPAKHAAEPRSTRNPETDRS